MIIKVIQHKNMENSVKYLYQKASNSDETGVHYAYNCCKTSEAFFDEINFVRNIHERDTGKTLDFNNQIKHLVMSVHPDDITKFEENKDVFISDLFNELGIDPNNHYMNAFIHNDQSHPHIHMIFSRNGMDKNIFDDSNIGRRVGEIAQKLSEKHNLRFQENSVKMPFTRNELYKPTTRSTLKKLINFGINEASSLKEFKDILKSHGVLINEKKDKLTYLIPNNLKYSEQEFQELLAFASDKSKTESEYQRILGNNGIKATKKDSSEYKYERIKYIPIVEDILPFAARRINIESQIRTRDSDPYMKQLRNYVKNAVKDARCLQDIKDKLPGSDIKYTIKNDRIFNIKIEFESHIFRLSEVFDKQIELEPTYENFNYMKIPLIFTPHDFNEYESKREEYLSKKARKKHRQIGFKVQI